MRTRMSGIIAMVMLVSTCASTPPGPPRNQENACAIFEQRPEWRAALESASLKWGAPVEVQMAIIWKESNFRARARPPKRYALGIVPLGRPSSAYGYSQAIDGTWEWYRKDTGNRGADRDDFDDATDFVGWYMFQSYAKNGIFMDDAFNQYIAYHQGHTGYASKRWTGDAWLKRTADKVRQRADLYRSQIANC